MAAGRNDFIAEKAIGMEPDAEAPGRKKTGEAGRQGRENPPPEKLSRNSPNPQ